MVPAMLPAMRHPTYRYPERRATPRARILLPADLRGPGLASCLVLNLSPEGACVEIPPGARDALASVSAFGLVLGSVEHRVEIRWRLGDVAGGTFAERRQAPPVLAGA